MSNTKTVPSIIENRRMGLIGEKIIKKIYKERGYKIISVTQGCDFIAVSKIPGTKNNFREYVEVKTGTSRPTKKQLIIMKCAIRRGDNYTVCHISHKFVKKFLENNEGILN